MLQVHRLTYCYGDVTAVNNINFNINSSEIVGLLGHNGAGKTTIMKMLSGYLEPHQGWIKINGIDLSLSPKKIQRDLGYLSENLPLYPELTVASYLDYVADLKGLAQDLKWAEIKRAVQAVDISERLLDPISKLSRGYKQRVGVAQAILGQPKLLILDEPSNGLDPAQTEHMRQLIRTIAKEATVILSTHIMQEVDAICNRVLILRNGQLAIDANLATLRQSNHLLLNTTMAPEAAQQQLQKIAGVEKIYHLDKEATTNLQKNRYRIATVAGQMDTTSSAIATAIIESGNALYLLQPEYRDLESLLRQVNEPTPDTDHNNGGSQ